VINKMDPTSPIRKTVLILLEEAGNDIQRLQEGIETWFNDTMDRVSGLYKRKAQFIIFIIAASLVSLSNAGTLQIVKTLSYEPTLRQELSRQAADLVKQSSAQPFAPAAPAPKGSEAKSDIKESSPPTQAQGRSYQTAVRSAAGRRQEASRSSNGSHPSGLDNLTPGRGIAEQNRRFTPDGLRRFARSATLV
jgi:hypothetical protein